MSYSYIDTQTHVENCKRCGAQLDVEWCEITTRGDLEPRYVPGQSTCPTGGCGSTCLICHRRPGDVHSGECGPVMERKLTDKVHVSREDCLAVPA